MTSTDGILGTEPVFDITYEVFTALVDQGETTLVRSARPWSVSGEVLYAWVDMVGSVSGRAVVRTGRDTAQEIARALLSLGPDAEVSDADLVDAVGEVANVVGGNLKSIFSQAGTLGLPQVSPTAPSAEGASLVDELVLEWRGRPLAVAVWRLD